MPRTGRIVIPNCPHHIVHRGHNRNPLFISDDDYHYYLKNLVDLKNELNCHVYSYCLMTNHVHLIIDPGEHIDALAILLKKVAARQTRYVNTLEKRTGTIWEGRYHSSPICKDSYLLACCRYIEMNPVRARMVTEPSGYRWSSYREKTEGRAEVIDPDPGYLSLGADETARRKSYREWVLSSVPEGEWERIHQAAQRGYLTGGEEFQQVVAERLGIRLDYKNPGRPRKR
ncbi:MAG TPA: transposase [Geobacter sp.]|nr:transposase [Geobacter sp.]